MMGVKGGLLLLVCLLVVVGSSSNVEARSYSQFGGKSKLSEVVVKNDELCMMCEDFTTRATEYFHQNKTQEEIIDALHQACAGLSSYEQQCILLVDYYAMIFFVDIDKIQPEEFCRKVNLCGKSISLDLPMSDEFCTACHDFVTEVITKLDDTDTQMELIVSLLKSCSKVEQQYVQQCKKLVLRYTPLILANGVKFLKNTDICGTIHACKANEQVFVSTV